MGMVKRANVSLTSYIAVIIKNISWSSLSFIFRLLSNFFVFIIIARVIGVEKFGEFSFLLLIATGVSYLSDSGFNLRFFRATSVDDRSEMEISISAKLWISCLSIVVSVLVSLYYQSWSLMLLTLALLTAGWFDFILNYLRANSRFREEAKYALINNGLFFVIASSVAVVTNSILSISVAFLFSRLMTLIYLYIGEIRGNESFSRLALRKVPISNVNIGFIFDYYITNAWMLVDGLLVKLFYGMDSLGLYNATSKFVVAFNSASTIITNVVFPRIAGDTKSNRVVVVSSLALFVFSASVFLVSIPIGDRLIEILLGRDFLLVENQLTYLLLPVVIKYSASSIGMKLVVQGHMKFRFLVQAFGLIVMSLSFFTATNIFAANLIIAVCVSMTLSYLTILFLYLLKVFVK